MTDLADERIQAELAHGRYLAGTETETSWGWGTPAGKLRAQRRSMLIAQAVGLGPGVRALEIGCGTGMFTEMFATFGGHILAVDLSPELLAKAQLRNLPRNRITFAEGPFERQTIPESLDAVIASSVLHHLDVSASLKKIRELLKPGGRVCFAEPNMLNPQIFMERKFRRFFPHISKHETAFVRWSLSRMLRAMGYRDISITPFDWLHPATPKIIIPWVRFAGLALEKTPFVREFSGSLLIAATSP